MKSAVAELRFHDLLRNVGRAAHLRKSAWLLLREFTDPNALEQRSSWRLNADWQVAQRRGSVQERAIKLLLQETRGDELGGSSRAASHGCEAVVLFPGKRLNGGPAGLPGSRTKRLPRATACVSSQPGCGVGCLFCATGQLGYRGDFSALQIVEQVYWCGVEARRFGYRLRNVVFMGMGEPLHNTSHVMEAIGWLTHQQLFGLQQKHLTLSTVGVPSSMQRVASAFPDIRLALSLHSADPAIRKRLVPHAIADLCVLRETIRGLNMRQSHPVWLEIVLLKDLNDRLADAAQVVEFCRGLRVVVNLIPYNLVATESGLRTSPRSRREAYAACLRRHDIQPPIERPSADNIRQLVGSWPGLHRAAAARELSTMRFASGRNVWSYQYAGS